jgi:hypothetical protein
VVEGEPGDFPESVEGREMSASDWSSYLSAFKNPGIALDMGAVYALNDQWEFSAALNNLGFIKWTEDLNSLSFNGIYSFKGLEVDGSNKDDLDAAVDAIGDSLKTVINYGVGQEQFSMGLIPGLYMGASYNLNHAISFGFLSRSQFQKNNFRQDFNLSANLQPYSFVALNVNYSLRVNGGNGLGTGVSLLMGPLQLFLLADYHPHAVCHRSYGWRRVSDVSQPKRTQPQARPQPDLRSPRPPQQTQFDPVRLLYICCNQAESCQRIKLLMDKKNNIFSLLQ